MRSMPGGNMSATWSPVLIFPFSKRRFPTRSAFLCNCEQDNVVATAPLELSSVKIMWSAVLWARHRKISEMNWYCKWYRSQPQTSKNMWSDNTSEINYCSACLKWRPFIKWMYSNSQPQDPVQRPRECKLNAVLQHRIFPIYFHW